MINNEWTNKVKNSKDYKKWVGKCNDFTGAVQFQLLTMMGLKEEHSLLDIGCGSLRAGKLFIPYLLSGNYHGLEKEKWLIDEVVASELGQELFEMKNPTIKIGGDFNILQFKKQFDFILCNSVFIHASKSQIETVFNQIDFVLKRNGKFVFNFIQGQKDNESKTWTYPSHVTYTRKTMCDLLKKYNLKYQFVDWWYPGKQQWVVIYA